MANGEIYIGCTKDLRKRIEQHKAGEVYTTKKYLPVKLIYYEAYNSEENAKEREDRLKFYGKALAQLKRRIKHSIEQ